MSQYARYPATSGGSSGVTSVGLSAPNIFTVSGSPVTTTGTLALTLATEAAGIVFAGPVSGSAATPTFRALAASDIPRLNPAQTISWIDDFDAGNAQGTTNFAVAAAGGTVVVLPSEVMHPGIVKIVGTTATTGVGLLYKPSYYLFSGGVYTLDQLIRIPVLSTATDSFSVQLGFGDSFGGGVNSNGAYFEYSDSVNSGNWVCTTTSASNHSPTNTATAVTTGWVHLRIIINAAATSVAFYIDGVLVATNTLQVPGATNYVGILDGLYRQASTGASLEVDVDMIAFSVAFTTARYT